MDFALSDTIVALASPPGNSTRGIVRISGPEAMPICDRLVEKSGIGDSDESVASLLKCSIRIPEINAPVSMQIYRWPTPRSFTGQPMCELHVVGSPPLLNAIMNMVCRNQVRPARQGEFTLRAFLAGKLDLMQAEAVLGVIDANDDEELLAAARQLGGGLSTPLLELRNQLLNDLADLEAGLDFVEEDIDFVDRTAFIERLNNGLKLVAQIASQADHRGTPGKTPKVVLAGLPNAGKSTLFNRFVGSNHAIVSNEAGTTRDFLTAELDWNGLSIELVDTAGWESASEDIMHAAQRLKKEQLEDADLVCWCTAADLKLNERALDASLLAEVSQANACMIRIVTKIDLATNRDESPADGFCNVSAVTGSGIQECLEQIATQLQDAAGERSGLLATTFARCYVSLEQTKAALESALQLANNGEGDELIALELRDALHQLAEMTGEVYTDDILDRIFSKFCIGK